MAIQWSVFWQKMLEYAWEGVVEFAKKAAAVCAAIIVLILAGVTWITAEALRLELIALLQNFQ